MSDRDLLVIIHSGGQLVWDNGSPVYSGGYPKMTLLKRSITFSQLVQKIHDLSNENKLGHVPHIQYLYQNGKVCTLVGITNDEDVEIMFRASAVDGSAAYLYIQPNTIQTIVHQSNEHRMGSNKLARPSSLPSVLGKRDATGQAHYEQDRSTDANVNEYANFNITLPSPKVNPTMKMSDYEVRMNNVEKESFFQQSCPPIDLCVDSDMVFSPLHYTCSTEENRCAEMDVGMDIDNENQDALHVDKELCEEGCCPLLHDEGENPAAKRDVGQVTDSDNIDSVQLVIERCKEGGYSVAGVENPPGKNRVGLGIDLENHDVTHIVSEGYAQRPRVYDQRIHAHAENRMEKMLNRNATSSFQYKHPVYEESEYVDTDLAVPVSVPAVPELPKAPIIRDTMQAADELLSMPTHEDPAHEIWKGRVFSSRDAFKTTLAKFAMYKNFCLKPLRTNRFEATARCSHPTCLWRIHASIVESGPQFQVRTYNPEHTCTGPLNGTNYPQATSNLIVDFIRDRLRVHQDYRPNEIISDFQREFGIQISYRKAHIAKEIAMEQIRGSFENSYKILSDYRLELKRTNPGTVDNLWTEDDHSFQRYYVCFGGCARSFKSSLRPLIALDGTHLRGKYPGALLIAVCQDGDHGLFPLAFAIVESECYATWSWFLANLALTLDNVQNLTIVSDRMKGLTNAVKDVILTAKHCYCCRHISQNIQAKFKNEGIVMKFWCAARSTRICEYENYMAEIRAIDSVAHDYIHAIGRKQWANAFIEGKYYDMLTTNIAESTNSLLKDIRELPITQQIESIRSKLMEFYQTRREKGLNMKNRVTPYVDKIISHDAEASRRLQCWQAGEFEFQVLSPEYTDIVHLDKRSCTCRKWDLLGIPCSHALCAIKLKRYDPYDFCEHWFTRECYQATYNDVIHATRDKNQWDSRSDDRVLPPVACRQPGRPKKCRIRTEDRMRKQITCSHCKQWGHNRQTCRDPPPRQ